MWRPPPAWAARGACLGKAGRDSDLWHGAGDHETDDEQRDREEAAKRVCLACPVLGACREWALQQLTEVEVHGVLAAMTPSELRAEARRRGDGGRPTVKHGTRSSYVGGCRCAKCREAHRVYEGARRARQDETSPAEPELAPPAWLIVWEAVEAAGGSLTRGEVRRLDGLTRAQAPTAVRDLVAAGVVQADRWRVWLADQAAPEAA